MRHLAALFGVIAALLIATAGCASNPPTATRADAAPTTQPADQRDVLRQQAQNLSLTKATLVLKNTRIKDEIAKLQAELNKEGVTTAPGQVSPRQMEMQAIIEQLNRSRTELDDAKARLEVLKQAADRGEFPSEIDEQLVGHPQLTKEAEGDLRIKLRDAMQKKLNEQVQIAQFKIKSLQARVDDLKSTNGEIDYKLFQLFQCKADQEEIVDQLRAIERRLQSIEETVRSPIQTATSAR